MAGDRFVRFGSIASLGSIASVRDWTLDVVHQAADVIHHRACLSCAALGTMLCGTCLGALGSPHRHDLGHWVAGDYEGSLRQAILAYKRRGWLGLDRPLGELLAAAVSGHLAATGRWGGSGPVILVPVPAHRDSLRERGVDAVRRIAEAAVGRLRQDGSEAMVWDGLELRREYSRNSVGSARGRRSVHGAFGAREGRPPTVGAGPAATGPGVFIVVDDVITTGATVREAMRALAVAAVQVSGAVAVAGTRRRSPVTP